MRRVFYGRWRHLRPANQVFYNKTQSSVKAKAISKIGPLAVSFEHIAVRNEPSQL